MQFVEATTYRECQSGNLLQEKVRVDQSGLTTPDVVVALGQRG